MAPGAGRVVRHFERPGALQAAYLRVRWWICPFDRVLPLVPEGGTLLDVGCGSGLWLSYLALERPGLALEGVDPDARKLDMARRSRAGALTLHQGRAEDVGEGRFDCITILDVLVMLPDEVKARVLEGCRRALKPGGTLIVKEIDKSPWWKFWPAVAEELVAVHGIRMTHGGELHFQTLGELASTVAAAGFVDAEPMRIDRGYLHPHVVVRAKAPWVGGAPEGSSG